MLLHACIPLCIGVCKHFLLTLSSFDGTSRCVHKIRDDTSYDLQFASLYST